MAQTLAEKLKIRADYVLRTLHAPSDFAAHLAPLPEGVHLSTGANRFDQLHWFVADRAQLERELPEVLPLISGLITCWVYFPKGGSGRQTDLTRDKGWDTLQANPNVQRLSLISFDDTWSAFAFRMLAAPTDKRTATFKARPIMEFIDAEKRTVHPPADLAAAFAASPLAAAFFEELSFTNKKEYVEWIVTAKKPETRAQRVEGTVERLERGWKNPRNL